jgi:hypothetical protein
MQGVLSAMVGRFEVLCFAALGPNKMGAYM